MELRAVNFNPFYEKFGPRRVVGVPTRIAIAIGLGGLYLIALLATLDNQTTFYTHRSWALGAIITVSLLSLYAATATFRNMLPIIYEIDADNQICKPAVKRWLSNNKFILYGLVFATFNTALGHSFGIPIDFLESPVSSWCIYAGLFIAGFTCGMAIAGIIGIVMIFDRFAPLMQSSLDYTDLDGSGGTQAFGNSLLLFSVVTLFTGVLISVYITGVGWEHKDTNKWVRFIIYAWIAFPYIMASFVLLVPLLAISHQISLYKRNEKLRLKREISELKNRVSNTEHKIDDDTSTDAKEQVSRMDKLQEDLVSVHQMKIFPINRESLINFIIGLVPGFLGTFSAVISVLKKIPG